MDNSKQIRKDEHCEEESSSYSNECWPQEKGMMYCPYMCGCPFMGHGEMNMGCGGMNREQEDDFDADYEDDTRNPRPKKPYYYHRPPYYPYPYYWYGYPKYPYGYPYHKDDWKKKKPGPWY